MSTQLAVVTSPDEIAGLPPKQRGELITRALVESKQWLAIATKGTDPTPIAHFKAWAATVAEMTKQKGLAEDIQLDALEMVRRAERGIGLAIRNGQGVGAIAKSGDVGARPSGGRGGLPGAARGQHLVRPADFASSGELSSNQAGIYAMTDALLGQAENIRRQTGNQKRHCVAAAAVEILNAGKGGRKLPTWWHTSEVSGPRLVAG